MLMRRKSLVLVAILFFAIVSPEAFSQNLSFSNSEKTLDLSRGSYRQEMEFTISDTTGQMSEDEFRAKFHAEFKEQAVRTIRQNVLPEHLKPSTPASVNLTLIHGAKPVATRIGGAVRWSRKAEVSYDVYSDRKSEFTPFPLKDLSIEVDLGKNSMGEFDIRSAKFDFPLEGVPQLKFSEFITEKLLRMFSSTATVRHLFVGMRFKGEFGPEFQVQRIKKSDAQDMLFPSCRATVKQVLEAS